MPGGALYTLPVELAHTESEGAEIMQLGNALTWMANVQLFEQPAWVTV